MKVHISERMWICCAVALALAFSVAISYGGIHRLRTYNAHSDLTCVQQHIFNTSQGRPYEYTIGRSINAYSYYWGLSDEEKAALVIRERQLGTHFSPIYLVNALIYKLVPTKETLIVTQAAVMALGGLLLFLVAAHVLGGGFLPLVVQACYYLYPPVLNQSIRDVHESMWAPLLAIGIVWALLARRDRLFWVFCLAFFMIKEYSGIFMFFLGLFLVARGERRKGLILLAVSPAWFLLTMKVFIPFFSQSAHAYILGGWFGSPLGGSPVEMIVNAVRSPSLLADTFLTQENLVFMHRILASWGYLPILSGFFLTTAIGAVLPNLMASNITFKLVWSHYEAAAIPVVALGAVFALARMKVWLRSLAQRMGAGQFMGTPLVRGLGVLAATAYLGVFTLTFHYPYTNFNLNNFFGVGFNHVPKEFANVPKAMAMIPPDASVSTTDTLSTLLAERREIYYFPVRWEISDYILLSKKERIWPIKPEDMDRYIRGVRESGLFKAAYEDEGIALFERIEKIPNPYGH